MATMNQSPLDVNKNKHARIIKGKFKIQIAHERHLSLVSKLFLNLKSNNFVSDVNYQNNQVSSQRPSDWSKEQANEHQLKIVFSVVPQLIMVRLYVASVATQIIAIIIWTFLIFKAGDNNSYRTHDMIIMSHKT